MVAVQKNKNCTSTYLLRLVEELQKFICMQHTIISFTFKPLTSVVIGHVQQLVITPTLSEACVLNHSYQKQHLKSSQRPQQHMQTSFQKICSFPAITFASLTPLAQVSKERDTLAVLNNHFHVAFCKYTIVTV